MFNVGSIKVKLLATWAAAAILLLLVGVFFAWKTSALPISLQSFLRMMSLGSAICLSLLTLAIWIKLFSGNITSIILALSVLLMSLLRCWELVTDSSYLNSAFIWLVGVSLNHAEGAMSFLTSVCLVLLSLSVLCSVNHKNIHKHWKIWITLALTFYVVLLVIIALSGYFLNWVFAFTWMGMRMSPHTAVVMIVLAAFVFSLNIKTGLQILYKTKINTRFLVGAKVVFLFGAIIFLIVQQQIKYVESINSQSLLDMGGGQRVDQDELLRVIKTEHDIKKFILILSGFFAIVCFSVFSGIFYSLTYQLKNLSNLLLFSTRSTLTDTFDIPYLTQKNEFGLIAKSIETFFNINNSRRLLQARLQQIIESMPNGIIIINSLGIIELVNKQTCLTFEYHRDELIGQPLEILMSSLIATHHPQLRKKYFENPEARTMGVGRELFGITKSGKEIALEIGLSPLESSSGAQILASVVDITDRKNAEQSLALSREKIQQLDTLRASIVEHSDDAIISKTVNGVITSWNRAAERMFGYHEAEVLGRNIKEIIIPVDRINEHDELLRQVTQGSIIRNYQSQSLCKNGGLLDVAITLSPIKDDKGNIVSISSIKRDISIAIQSANKILDHQKELERSNQSLEAFAYVASHDLKAPLRGISQLTGWLEEDIRDNHLENVSGTTQKIKVRIKRMESLLDDLLAYYRVEKMQGSYKTLDLKQSIIDLFHLNNTHSGLTLIIENELPQFETFIAPIEQVFTNLIANAVKHHDKPNGIVSISSREVDKYWFEFSVADDGPGIDPQFHQRIFNLFQTLKSKDEVEGSGIGLALVKKIVEQYGGSIRIESVSRGACFKFTWPISLKREQNVG